MRSKCVSKFVILPVMAFGLIAIYYAQVSPVFLDIRDTLFTAINKNDVTNVQAVTTDVETLLNPSKYLNVSQNGVGEHSIYNHSLLLTQKIYGDELTDYETNLLFESYNSRLEAQKRLQGGELLETVDFTEFKRRVASVNQHIRISRTIYDGDYNGDVSRVYPFSRRVHVKFGSDAWDYDKCWFVSTGGFSKLMENSDYQILAGYNPHLFLAKQRPRHLCYLDLLNAEVKQRVRELQMGDVHNRKLGVTVHLYVNVLNEKSKPTPTNFELLNEVEALNIQLIDFAIPKPSDSPDYMLPKHRAKLDRVLAEKWVIADNW